MSKIYVTSVDETTGQCHGVGIGTDTEIYETFGMFQVDAEQSDKDGYDLDTYYIGNEIIKKHYILLD